MKALEYYEKYSQLMFRPNNTTVDYETLSDHVYDMAMEFVAEAHLLSLSRNPKTPPGGVTRNCLQELNTKWNAVVRLFEKNHGISPVKRNGLLTLYEERK